ncbi:hypothetical protein D3C75_966630 [compost metagenome]
MWRAEETQVLTHSFSTAVVVFTSDMDGIVTRFSTGLSSLRIDFRVFRHIKVVVRRELAGIICSRQCHCKLVTFSARHYVDLPRLSVAVGGCLLGVL